MCTLTFAPRRDGWLIAMNRDDARVRPQALPPSISATNGDARLIGPREPSGGMWIAASDTGIAFALLNRYTGAPAYPKQRSRGEIIPVVAAASSASEVRTRMQREPLAGVHPFRLFGFFPLESTVLLAAWDGRQMDYSNLAWEQQHWFSSGLSDSVAAERRGAIAARQPQPLTLTAVRALHRSHDPEPGPFSVCVHRELVQTLSYTEVDVSAGNIVVRYRPGSPCEPAVWHEASLPLMQAFPSRG